MTEGARGKAGCGPDTLILRCLSRSVYLCNRLLNERDAAGNLCLIISARAPERQSARAPERQSARAPERQSARAPERQSARAPRALRAARAPELPERQSARAPERQSARAPERQSIQSARALRAPERQTRQSARALPVRRASLWLKGCPPGCPPGGNRHPRRAPRPAPDGLPSVAAVDRHFRAGPVRLRRRRLRDARRASRAHRASRASEDTRKLRLLAATVQGATLTMTFNKRLDPDSEPAAARFIVRFTNSNKESVAPHRYQGGRQDGRPDPELGGG